MPKGGLKAAGSICKSSFELIQAKIREAGHFFLVRSRHGVRHRAVKGSVLVRRRRARGKFHQKLERPLEADLLQQLPRGAFLVRLPRADVSRRGGRVSQRIFVLGSRPPLDEKLVS